MGCPILGTDKMKECYQQIEHTQIADDNSVFEYFIDRLIVLHNSEVEVLLSSGSRFKVWCCNFITPSDSHR